MSTIKTAPHSSALLRLQSISLSFKGVNALSDVGFDVGDGEICALIGPNGAGKSSLLNVISGVYRPHRGRIFFDNAELGDIRPHVVARSGIARTFQNLALFKSMSVLDNLLAGSQRHLRSHWLEQSLNLGRAPAENLRQQRRAEEILEFLHLQALRDAIVGHLPYGLQKRIELGRALAAEPRLLLLDEPMAGMNAGEKADMSRYIRDINHEYGTTVILIEHDIGVVMELARHVVVLDYGRKIGDGAPEQIRCNPEVIAAYLGTRH